MLRWYCLLFVIFGTYAIGIAQGSDLNAWFDLQRSESGQAVIKGMVKNKSNKTLAYSYSMRLTKAGPSGKAISTQSGSFTLLPKEEKITSEISINLGATATFEVALKIFDDEGIVADEKMLSDEKFISDFQKLLPQKTSPDKIVANPTVVKKTRNTATDAIEIEGLIIDETRSKTGRDYYEFFYGKWIAPQGVSDFTITIKEIPARGRGARISVEVNGNLLIQRMLQPRLDVIELLAEQSVNAVKKYLVDNEKLKSDLEAGDQKGSGVY